MSKITEFAKGKPCQIRMPGVCNGRNETVVHCHLNGGGMGMKQPDFLGAHGCSACHDVIDGRVSTGMSRDIVNLYFYEGVFKTQKLLVAAGIELK